MRSEMLLTLEERGRGRGHSALVGKGLQSPLLALSNRKGTPSQGMQAASRSQTWQGDGFSPGVSRRAEALRHLDFSLQRAMSDL